MVQRLTSRDHHEENQFKSKVSFKVPFLMTPQLHLFIWQMLLSCNTQMSPSYDQCIKGKCVVAGRFRIQNSEDEHHEAEKTDHNIGYI